MPCQSGNAARGFTMTAALMAHSEVGAMRLIGARGAGRMTLRPAHLFCLPRLP
jgi:hypothetical protein